MASLAAQLAVWMFAGFTLYAVFGGADFGAGIWSLLAHGPKAPEQRTAITHAMGPVWEANHTWLVFGVIILLSAFPAAFHVASVAFYLPLHVILAGIVLRGTAFVLKAAPAMTERSQRIWNSVFGIASIATPLGLGTALGALSTGGVRITDAKVIAHPTASWLDPFALGSGILAVALCAFLAAVFLVLETDGRVQGNFRKQALRMGSAVIALMVLQALLTQWRLPFFWARMSEFTPAFLAALSLAAAIGANAALWWRKFTWARAAAVVQTVALMWSWAAAQWPFLIYPDLTITRAAAPIPTLRFMLAVLPWGAALVIPSLLLLFWVFKQPQAPSVKTDQQT